MALLPDWMLLFHAQEWFGKQNSSRHGVVLATLLAECVLACLLVKDARNNRGCRCKGPQINLVFGFHTVFVANCKMPDKVMLASQSCLMLTSLMMDTLL